MERIFLQIRLNAFNRNIYIAFKGMIMPMDNEIVFWMPASIICQADE